MPAEVHVRSGQQCLAKHDVELPEISNAMMVGKESTIVCEQGSFGSREVILVQRSCRKEMGRQACAGEVPMEVHIHVDAKQKHHCCLSYA